METTLPQNLFARRTSVNSPSCWILSNSEVMLSLDVVELDEVL